ncbi:MAG: serine protease [Gammaproteobacteria bacterium]|nr:serine protease [Gammaproteobacteria bacterium]
MKYKPLTDEEFEELQRQPQIPSDIVAGDFFDSGPAPYNGLVESVANEDPQTYSEVNDNVIAEIVYDYKRSVGRIFTESISNLGTGFLINSVAILVSKHAIIDVVDLETGEFAEPVYIVFPTEDGLEKSVKIIGCLEDGSIPSDGVPAFDYAILKLSEPVEAPVLPLIHHDAPDADKQPFGNLWTLHYPDGEDLQRLSIGESGGGEQHKLIADYVMATSHCSSGAPIIDINGFVLGLHRGVMNFQGYRFGELLHTIYADNTSSILKEISINPLLELKQFPPVRISPCLPPLRDDETLHGFFHDPNDPSKLYHVGRHIGSKDFVGIEMDEAKKLNEKQTRDASFVVGVDKHLVKEYNGVHVTNPIPMKTNGTQKIRLDNAWLDRCHRISAEDIQENICEAINVENKENLCDFAELLYQSDENAEAKAECDTAIELIKTMFELQDEEKWIDRTKAANELYKHMFRANYNLSFGHKSTNSGIGQQLDLNFQYDSEDESYKLTPRSRRISENAHKFKFTAPKIVGDEVYSSHVIDAHAPNKHDFKNPDKGSHRTIQLEEIEENDRELIAKI